MLRRLFKNRIFRLIFFTVFLLILIGSTTKESSRLHWLNNMASVPLYPFQKLATIVSNKFEDNFTYFKDVKAVRQENETLKARVDQLEQEKSKLEYLEKQNKELSEVLALKDRYSNYKPIGGNVIARDTGNWSNIFTIDVGSADGIEASSSKDLSPRYYPVITGKGLVGRIISVSGLSSKVRSIIDEESTVSAILTKSRQYVVVKGDLTLKQKGLCIVDGITSDIDISEGDTIETSGDGGIYPKGITIGKVLEVKKSGNDYKTYAVLQPAVDFKRLETVTVLKDESGKMEAGSAEQ